MRYTTGESFGSGGKKLPIETARRRRTSTVVPFLLCPCLVLFGVTPDAAAESVSLAEHLSIDVKARRLANSHTSYEFGTPFPPNQSPLSRLEFPLNSWWGGAELRASFPRFSTGVEVLTNDVRDAGRPMKDSDWEDIANPGLRTTYSESGNRIKRSYMVAGDVDMEVSDWLGLPRWASLRPVTGFRWQSFDLVTHDGVQYSLLEAPLPLPGDGIRFRQVYKQYFIGLRSNVDAERFTNISGLNFLAQVDWAHVEGRNEDHHLLRPGSRFTYENTHGRAWHASVGLRKSLYRNWVLGVDADYLRINTIGSHRMVYDLFGIDLSWSNGVRVWSEQTGVTLSLKYRF